MCYPPHTIHLIHYVLKDRLSYSLQPLGHSFHEEFSKCRYLYNSNRVDPLDLMLANIFTGLVVVKLLQSTV